MTPYSAAPLTDDQRAEVLRVMSDCTERERHNFRVHLDVERTVTLRELREQPERGVELRARADAFARVFELLDACWPTPDLAPRQAA